MQKTVEVQIKRRERAEASPRWESFSVPYRANLNVIIILQDILRNPVTKQGRKTTPVAWECSCLEEVCGACSMLVNGKAMQACSALVDKLKQPIRLEPFSKFPVVRDLIVDRSSMFENLKRVRAWIPVDGTYDLGPGPRMAADEQQRAYPFSRCMTCGCCVEVCPQVNASSPFIGAAAIGQVHLMNSHPTGRMHRAERLQALMEPDGIEACGNAQNCVESCPKEIPLTTSIAAINRELTEDAFLGWLKK